jgi:hypothetical protein
MGKAEMLWVVNFLNSTENGMIFRGNFILAHFLSCVCESCWFIPAYLAIRGARNRARAIMSTVLSIDEVTEEVRKDKLSGYMRKYGWIKLSWLFC